LIYRLILNKTITLERKNNRAHRHRSKEFLGAQDTHLDTIKKYYPKLVARGTTLKAFGEEILDEFENRFQRLMLHFTRYNNIDSNVIERVILGENQDDRKTLS
jgi:phosphate starvation-inducible PhoH-like protein